MDDPERGEYERAATGYLVWPISLFGLAREAPGASTWSRIHTRQAATYGLIVTLGYVALMALPLIVVMSLPSISTGATVLVYEAGLVADLVVFCLVAAATVGYARRASRGELFAIPFVSAVADRIFRLPR